MIYIVTMLLVFSAGIASLMVIYMKKEQVEKCNNKYLKKTLQREREDENLYKNYVDAAR